MPDFEPAEVAHAKDIVQDVLENYFEQGEDYAVEIADEAVEALLRAGVYFPAQLVSPYTNLPANARPDGLDLIRAERARQIEQEGYDLEADSRHSNGELANAGASYAMTPKMRTHFGHLNSTPDQWPWGDQYWKPTPDDRIRELTKAGALILAELDRLITEQRRNDIPTQ